jgi:hypothetical protein
LPRHREAELPKPNSQAGASLPLSYGFPVCQRWSARFILHVFSRVCALCKINLALQFWLNLMVVKPEFGNAHKPMRVVPSKPKPNFTTHSTTCLMSPTWANT